VVRILPYWENYISQPSHVLFECGAGLGRAAEARKIFGQVREAALPVNKSFIGACD
jgi:hypothetical protein